MSAKVEIWLDDDGDVVDAPATPGDADAAGVMVAAVGWLTFAGLLALAQVIVHRVLDRRRYRVWGEEWARVEPGWNNHRR